MIPDRDNFIYDPVSELGIDHAIAVVEAALAQPEGVSAAHLEKVVTRLGDRAAIAAIKIYGFSNIRQNTVAPRLLWLIETSFRDPHIISAPADRRPDFSILVLEMLLNRAVPAEIDRINGLLTKLRDILIPGATLTP
jgi:hypothetical protein